MIPFGSQIFWFIETRNLSSPEIFWDDLSVNLISKLEVFRKARYDLNTTKMMD